jgi:hypothetical protein
MVYKSYILELPWFASYEADIFGRAFTAELTHQNLARKLRLQASEARMLQGIQKASEVALRSQAYENYTRVDLLQLQQTSADHFRLGIGAALAHSGEELEKRMRWLMHRGEGYRGELTYRGTARIVAPLQFYSWGMRATTAAGVRSYLWGRMEKLSTAQHKGDFCAPETLRIIFEEGRFTSSVDVLNQKANVWLSA